MTKEEFGFLAAVIKTSYPAENIMPNKQAMAIWYEQLKDIPYKIAERELYNWISKEKWSPKICDIRQACALKLNGNIKSWGEAWEEVVNLIRKYGSYSIEEAYEDMDELTRKVVKQVGYFDICMSENVSVERANFRNIYEQEIEKKKKDLQSPEGLKRLVTSKGMLEDHGGE